MVIVLYPIERPLALPDLLPIYAPHALPGFGKHMSRPRMQREGIALLLQAQATAYQNNDLDVTISIAEGLVALYFDQGDFDSARIYVDQLMHLITGRDNPTAIARVHGMLGVCSLMTGDSQNAYASFMRGLAIVSGSEHRVLAGFLYCHTAMTLCYQGRYAEADDLFKQAEKTFRPTGNDLGKAWLQHIYARDFLADRGEVAQAAADLSAALGVLDGRVSVPAVIDNLVATTACLLRLSEVDRARVLVQRLETLVIDGQRPWFHPELLLLRGRLAFAENNWVVAEQHLRAGIGAVSMNGDVRMLSPLYRALGRVLERDRARHGDARDAFERGIQCGRGEARRLHLALALHQAGNHLKRMATRPTDRARGSGYLFESHHMLLEMGLDPKRVTG